MKSFQQIILDEYFEPTLGRGIRVTLAFILPLIWGMTTNHMESAIWIAITAQILSNISIRGSYPLKLLILSGGVLACAVCAALGTLAGNHWISAVLIMMALSFIGGFVRQSGDHGPGIAIGVLLLYLLSIDHPGNFALAGEMFVWVLVGGILALAFTLAAWAFVPFSPFRRSIALTWKSLSDWLHIFAEQLESTASQDPVNSLDEKELALRLELNNSMELLSRRQALAHARQNRYSYYLVELRRMVSAAGNAVSALRTIIETATRNERFPLKLLHYVLDDLAQSAQRLALSIITHRPEDVYATRLGIERSKQSIQLFMKSLEHEDRWTIHRIHQALEDLVHCFDEALETLERTNPSRGNMTFFLRNFLTGVTIPQQIPWVKFEFNARSFTFRFSLRLALAMGISIAAYKYFHIPHGYWIAMTTMIILQPEFGATITKAFRRLKGTILGATFGSLLFLVAMPLPVNMAIVVVCSFLMTFFLLRNYAVAAFFITVMVIALFHMLEPVTWQLGGIRVLNTLAGAGMAMLGGYAFWPLWERYRIPTLLQEAIRANRQYLAVILGALKTGKKMTFNDFIKARREAEMTNNNAFLSLRRMEEEPEQKQHRSLQQFFIITGHSIRTTRLMNTLNQQIRDLPDALILPSAGAYQDCMEDILLQTENIFSDERHRDKKSAQEQQMVQKIRDILVNSLPQKPDAEKAVIVDLLETISKETVGMYYVALQLDDPMVKILDKEGQHNPLTDP